MMVGSVNPGHRAGHVNLEAPPTSAAQNPAPRAQPTTVRPAVVRNSPRIRVTQAEIRLREKSAGKEAKTAHAVELNGKVEVARTSGDDPQFGLVECRHFSLEFAQHADSKRKLMNEFSTLGSIENKFCGRLDEVESSFYRLIREAPQDSKHVVSSDLFGDYLQSIGAALKNSPSGSEKLTQANCLLLTGDHAMALHVQKICNHGVEAFSVKLYDPNTTADYKHLMVSTPEELSGLEMKNFMSKPSDIDEYGAGGGSPLSMLAVALDPQLKPPMDRSAVTPSAENMHVALMNGAHDAGMEMLMGYSNQNNDEKNTLFDLLQAKSPIDQEVGLHMALQGNHQDTVQTFTGIILASEFLESGQKVELLEAKRPDGVPGLHMALDMGCSGSIQAFTEGVLSSSLQLNAKVNLLATKNPDGWPGLRMAFQNGHTNAVSVFAQNILASNLPDDDKVGLLQANSPSGQSGLKIAGKIGHEETVQAFIQMVNASSLPDEKKELLLLQHSPVSRQALN